MKPIELWAWKRLEDGVICSLTAPTVDELFAGSGFGAVRTNEPIKGCLAVRVMLVEVDLLVDVANDFATEGCDGYMGTISVEQMNKVRAALGWKPLEDIEDGEDGSEMSAEGQHYTKAAAKRDAINARIVTENST